MNVFIALVPQGHRIAWKRSATDLVHYDGRENLLSVGWCFLVVWLVSARNCFGQHHFMQGYLMHKVLHSFNIVHLFGICLHDVLSRLSKGHKMHKMIQLIVGFSCKRCHFTRLGDFVRFYKGFFSEEKLIGPSFCCLNDCHQIGIS